jgi:hypothetical protein
LLILVTSIPLQYSSRWTKQRVRSLPEMRVSARYTNGKGRSMVWRGMLLQPDVSLLYLLLHERSMAEVHPYHVPEVVA